MDFDTIFSAYYNLYRADSDVPASTDAEYTVGIALANEAINRWSNYDTVYWKELFTTLQASTQTSPTLVTAIATGTTTYTAPTDFKEAGGHVRVLKASGALHTSYPIIEPGKVQFMTTEAKYCYFTGSPKDGYTLNLNPAPISDLNGLEFDYTYYKKPTLFTTGTDITEMSDPYFIVHRMLASQFRAARNPYYSSAKSDAENALGQMKMENDSGNWSNPATITDNSGTVFGQGIGNSFFRSR